MTGADACANASMDGATGLAAGWPAGSKRVPPQQLIM
jgi:hypothetical protein